MTTNAFGKSVAVTLALAMSVAMYGCSQSGTDTTTATTAAVSSSQTTETKYLTKEDITVNETKENSADGEHAITADGETASYSDLAVKKTGNSSGDEADFYGENAAVFATNKATLDLKGILVETAGEHANAVFSYGEGTTVNVSDSVIETTGNCSGGIMTTGGATMNAENLTIHTTGNSSAAIRSDRGGGTVTVSKGSYTTDGPGLSRVGALAVALAAELAPAGCLTWRGCPRVCLCACPCGCTSLVCTLSKVLCLEGGVGARGEGGPRWGEGAGLTSSGRRRWWLQVGLGTAQVPGRMGAQGHGWAAPRPAGGSEDRGPQRAPRPWAANALGRWARGWGRGGGPRAGWCLEGPRVGERQDLRAPHATLPPTRPGRHTRPAAPGPGSPVVPRAGPAECWPGVTGGGGRGGVGRPPGRRQSGRGWCSSSAARAPWRAGELRPPAGPTGRSERKAGAAQGS